MDFQRYRNANRKLMQKMGGVIANNKSDFVDMLDTCNVNFSGNDEAELISCYVDELPDNDQLKVMSAYLVEHNATSGFSGQIDNDEVYENYNVIYNYWDWDLDGEDVSNAGGVVGAVAGGVGELAKLGGTALQGRQKKKYGATDTAQKQAEAKTELIKSVIAQKQAKAETEKALADAKSKKTKYWIIGGSVIGGLVIISSLVYFMRKK